MRASGILMGISSIPSKYGIGCFSKEAYDFVDQLEKAGQQYWQILPLGPTGYGDSPYQSVSTFAGNPYFIDLEELIKKELLTKEECEACDYTNNSSSSSSALVDVQLSAKQNGEKLSPAVPKEDEPAIDNYIAEVEPRSTVTVCYAFSLNDKSDVTLEASEAFAFGGGNVTSQTIKLQ